MENQNPTGLNQEESPYPERQKVGTHSIYDHKKSHRNYRSMILWFFMITSIVQPVFGQNEGQKPQEEQKKPKKKRPPVLGVLLDVGVPDGVGLSLAVRPFSWLRLHGGGTSDLVSGGVRGGASFIVPVPFFIQPSATIEGGYQFPEKSNWLASQFSNNPYFSNPWLQQIGYGYINGHLGLEMGNSRFTFYIHGGLSYIRTTIRDFQQQLIAQSTSSPSLVLTNPNIDGVIPSAKLGFVVYFW